MYDASQDLGTLDLENVQNRTHEIQISKHVFSEFPKFLPLKFDGCQEDMFDESHLGTMAWENVQNRTHEIQISKHVFSEFTNFCH